MTPNDRNNYLSPREYLRGKSWEERRKIGIAYRLWSIEAMKRRLEDSTVDQLVDRFADIGVAQDKALLYDEHKRFNRLFSEMNEVDQELRRRGVEARQALLRLYDHPNMQVRVKAAIRTLAIAPAAARRALQEIKETHCYPQAADASMILRDFDNGSYKPD